MVFIASSARPRFFAHAAGDVELAHSAAHGVPGEARFLPVGRRTTGSRAGAAAVSAAAREADWGGASGPRGGLEEAENGEVLAALVRTHIRVGVLYAEAVRFNVLRERMEAILAKRPAGLRRRQIGKILIGRRKFRGGFHGASEIFLRPRKTKV